MHIIDLLSGVVILLFCVYLIGLAILIVLQPKRAERFFGSFASSARTHFAEQAARLIVGIEVVVLAPPMWYSNLFTIFGGILIVPSIGLMLISWQ